MHRGAEEKAGVRPEDHEVVRLTARPKGLAAADLTPVQQEQLRALLGVYLGRVPDELAEREAVKFAGERLGQVYFAWAGGTERHRAAPSGTTTGCRGRACWSSTTTPSAT